CSSRVPSGLTTPWTTTAVVFMINPLRTGTGPSPGRGVAPGQLPGSRLPGETLPYGFAPLDPHSTSRGSRRAVRPRPPLIQSPNTPSTPRRPLADGFAALHLRPRPLLPAAAREPVAGGGRGPGLGPPLPRLERAHHPRVLRPQRPRPHRGRP